MVPLNVLAVPEAESRSDQRPGDESLPSHCGSARVQTASCRRLQPVPVSLHGSHHNGSSARGADVAGGDGTVLQETWRGVSLPAGPVRACVPGSGRGRMLLGDDDVRLGVLTCQADMLGMLLGVAGMGLEITQGERSRNCG